MMSNFFSNLKIAIGMGIVCHIVFSFQIDNLFLIKLVSCNVRIFKSAATATDFMIFLKDDLFMVWFLHILAHGKVSSIFKVHAYL